MDRFCEGCVELKPELGGRNFECPAGIKFVEIDADNGSLSTLSCPHRELIAVTERLAPTSNVSCMEICPTQLGWEMVKWLSVKAPKNLSWPNTPDRPIERFKGTIRQP